MNLNERSIHKGRKSYRKFSGRKGLHERSKSQSDLAEVTMNDFYANKINDIYQKSRVKSGLQNRNSSQKIQKSDAKWSPMGDPKSLKNL